MRRFDIVTLSGDGIGPEVTQSAITLLGAVGDNFGYHFNFIPHLIGGIALDQMGDPYPEATEKACLRADAVLLGAVGGPQWDGQAQRPEQGLLRLRKSMGLFANLRPLSVSNTQAFRSPLKADIVEGTDMLIVRELTGGLYFGKRTRTPTEATDECRYSVEEITRVARVAFFAARQRRQKVTSVDKANVIETSRLWRETVTKLHHDEFSDITLEHALVDSMAMHLVTRPKAYDVILTENMFGDILSDLASVLAGSIGLLGSASTGLGTRGLYEPIHGSAPDIAGKNIANPLGMLRSVAMCLRFSLDLDQEAKAIDDAIDQAIANHQVTPDLGGTLSTSEVTNAVSQYIRHTA
jgi:3-isopropylmalate dehydrogenase